MACRVQRNEAGNITQVNNIYGKESELYNQLDAAIGDAEIAYAAYLKASNDATSAFLKQEPRFEEGIVQNVVQQVEEN